MSQPNLFYDYSKRDYLLPAGCKDLIDVLNHPKPSETWPEWSCYEPPTSIAIREVCIPEPVTIRALAQLLGLKPFRIVACLMAECKMFKNINENLDFGTAAKVSLLFGFKAVKMQF